MRGAEVHIEPPKTALMSSVDLTAAVSVRISRCRRIAGGLADLAALGILKKAVHLPRKMNRESARRLIHNEAVEQSRKALKFQRTDRAVGFPSNYAEWREKSDDVKILREFASIPHATVFGFQDFVR